MPTIFLFLLAMCVAACVAAPVWAAEYEIYVHPYGPVGGDGFLTCQTGKTCAVKVDMPEHAPLLVEAIVGEKEVALSFVQGGLRLLVQAHSTSKAMPSLTVPLEAFDAANPIKADIKIYAPDAESKPIYPGIATRGLFINPVVIQPGALPVKVKASIRRITLND